MEHSDDARGYRAGLGVVECLLDCGTACLDLTELQMCFSGCETAEDTVPNEQLRAGCDSILHHRNRRSRFAEIQ
ncbi:hypothetical protein AWN90_02855 [Nocardia terpenica]|uniref:Uncharacterized protein n=1 Tax=Nocardia terpenica TaxID=455432 RepID=A0A164KS77_9NOCA|nr:hypothetical protein AWN90_02855 [Nocardia terpenica]